MPPTTGYSFGDVVLVQFPFTDQAGTKKRPSAIKPVITTIEQALVIRRLGQLTTEDQQALRNAIAKIVG